MVKHIQNTQIQQLASEPPTTFSRICQHNTETTQKQTSFTLPEDRIQKSVSITFPAIMQFPDLTIKQTERRVPRPPKFMSKPKFPIYQRMFSFVYYLIGEQDKGIWNQFGNVYQQILPNQSISNRSSIKNTENLHQFIKSGMQVRLLIETEMIKKKVQLLESLLQNSQIIEVCIESESELAPSIKQSKIRYVTSMENVFEKQVKRIVRKSCKKLIHYNFIQIDSKSPQLLKRKNLLQKCTEPKKKQQYLLDHKNFTIMLSTYDNVKILDRIDEEYNNQGSQSSAIYIAKIKILTERIQQIHSEQFQFCQKFKQYIMDKDPIQSNPDRQQIFIRIVQQYKMQHSIYQILNNQIRLSICVNQTSIKCLSTFIKYLYEAIRYFFIKQLKTINIKQVFRGALLPIEQIHQLEAGKYLFNIGFMSTSKDRKIGEEFQRSYGINNEMSYLFVIDLGVQYKDAEYSENQQGFFYLPEQFKNLKINDKMGEEEVLFNPLNIFKILSINKKKRILHLEYSPHVKLIKKMKGNEITSNEKQQYERILSSIVHLNKSNYDKVDELRKKGKRKSALIFYDEITQLGEIPTINQKNNVFEILTENKDYDLVEKQITRMMEDQSKIKNPQEKQLSQIVRLGIQSEHNQTASKFFEAEKQARAATIKSQALLKKMEEKRTKQNDQIIQMLLTNLKTKITLAKSRLETNSYEQSMGDCYVGFKILDKIYQMYDQFMERQICEIMGQQLIVNTDKKFENLVYVNQIKKWQKNHRQRMEKQIIQEEFNQLKIIDKQQKINQYFRTRVIKQNYIKFYNASFQIESYNCNTVQLKKLKTLLFKHKQNFEHLIALEINLFQLIINSMKLIKKQIVQECIENFKKDFYEKRFKLFMRYNQREINTQNIRYKSQQYGFLLRYCWQLAHNQSQQSINNSQTTVLNALQQLTKKIQKQSQIEEQSFSIQKSYILQTQASYYKSSCLQRDIIQKAASHHTKGKYQFHTISSSRSKKNYTILKQRLTTLQNIHQSDPNLNKFNFIMDDVIQQVSAMNDAYNACDSYLSQLEEANNKLKHFWIKYMPDLSKSIERNNQKIAELYYLQAQNKLRRGFYRQAETSLRKAQQLLQNIYGSSINKLYARMVSIDCYRLEAQLIGIYGDYKQRAKSLQKLSGIKDFCYGIIYQPNTLAMINEALAFIAIRCLPLEISQSQEQTQKINKIYEIAKKALQKSIQYRQQSLGKQNSYMAIDYSNMVMLGARKNIRREQTADYYDKGRAIYKKLEQQMKNEPILYLYQMIMFVNFQKSREKIDIEKIAKIYRDGCSEFLDIGTNLRGVFIAEQFYQAGKYLYENMKDIDNCTKFMTKSEQDLYAIQAINSVGKQNELIRDLQQKIQIFLERLWKQGRGSSINNRNSIKEIKQNKIAKNIIQSKQKIGSQNKSNCLKSCSCFKTQNNGYKKLQQQ